MAVDDEQSPTVIAPWIMHKVTCQGELQSAVAQHISNLFSDIKSARLKEV